MYVCMYVYIYIYIHNTHISLSIYIYIYSYEGISFSHEVMWKMHDRSDTCPTVKRHDRTEPNMRRSQREPSL